MALRAYQVNSAVLLALLLVSAGCATRRPSSPVPLPLPTPSPFAERLNEITAALHGVNEILAMMGEEDTRGRHCLPEHLRDRLHDDWPPGLNKIPRALTAFCGQGPAWPEEISVKRRKPIPPPGTETWHLWDKAGYWRPYYALTTRDCWHLRVGFRWDDSPDDLYYNLVLPWMATFKRVLAAGCNDD